MSKIPELPGRNCFSYGLYRFGLVDKDEYLVPNLNYFLKNWHFKVVPTLTQANLVLYVCPQTHQPVHLAVVVRGKYVRHRRGIEEPVVAESFVNSCKGKFLNIERRFIIDPQIYFLKVRKHLWELVL